jgi:sulfide:quinone oxidoreductase
MGKKIIILGAGFAGLSISNILRKNLDFSHDIIVIDKKDYFMMGLANLWILDGRRRLEDSKIPLKNLESKGITFIKDEITNIDTKSKLIKTLHHRDHLHYDFLVIALGADISTNMIPGFNKQNSFNLYDGESISCLRKKILSLEKGKIAIVIMGFPYKCPPAPYESALIIDRMICTVDKRNKIDINIYFPSELPLPSAGEQPNSKLVLMLKKQNINLFPNHSLKEVYKYNLEFHNSQKKEYDILIGIPFHFPPSVLKKSGLIEEKGNWMSVNKFTLETRFKDIFAIGDVTEIKINEKISIPKAGIFAEGQARSVASQIIQKIKMGSQEYHQIVQFDGKGFCFMDTGNGKAGFIDTNFYNSNGPVTILKEPSILYYKKKINFEKQRMKEWL